MTWSDSPYETTLQRAGLGLLAGIAGSAPILLLTEWVVWMTQRTSMIPMPQEELDGIISALVAMWFYIGMLIIIFGVPVWLVLHSLRWRRATHAMLVGSVLSFVFVLVTGHITNTMSYTQAGTVAFTGGIVGFIIWRVAYRRSAPVPAS